MTEFTLMILYPRNEGFAVSVNTISFFYMESPFQQFRILVPARFCEYIIRTLVFQLLFWLILHETDCKYLKGEIYSKSFERLLLRR